MAKKLGRLKSPKRTLTSKDSELEKAIDIAYRYLSYRARTVSEVAEKLKKRQVTPENIEKVILKLKDLKLLDDRSFAISMSKEIVRLRGCGPYYIRGKLRQKGIDNTIAEEAAAAAFSEESERSVAIRLASKKMKGQQLSSKKERERLSRFIKAKGYSWDIVKEALEYIDDRERD